MVEAPGDLLLAFLLGHRRSPDEASWRFIAPLTWNADTSLVGGTTRLAARGASHTIADIADIADILVWHTDLVLSKDLSNPEAVRRPIQFIDYP
jgi:hypothetical protein